MVWQVHQDLGSCTENSLRGTMWDVSPAGASSVVAVLLACGGVRGALQHADLALSAAKVVSQPPLASLI